MCVQQRQYREFRINIDHDYISISRLVQDIVPGTAQSLPSSDLHVLFGFFELSAGAGRLLGYLARHLILEAYLLLKSFEI